jgi:hypothetical protein
VIASISREKEPPVGDSNCMAIYAAIMGLLPGPLYSGTLDFYVTERVRPGSMKKR